MIAITVTKSNKHMSTKYNMFYLSFSSGEYDLFIKLVDDLKLEKLRRQGRLIRILLEEVIVQIHVHNLFRTTSFFFRVYASTKLEFWVINIPG